MKTLVVDNKFSLYAYADYRPLDGDVDHLFLGLSSQTEYELIYFRSERLKDSRIIVHFQTVLFCSNSITLMRLFSW